MSTPSFTKLSRIEKTRIARALHENLVARAQSGPADPALDAFIPQLDVVATRLEGSVGGKDAADAARAAHADRVEKADVEVDSLCRHTEGFLHVEAARRQGPYVDSARILHAAAFPRGRAFLDDHIPDQNAEVRRVLGVLRASEHAQTMLDIRFPMDWLERLSAAVSESEAAFVERAVARGSIGDHVSLGKEAETAWGDVVGRLRKHVESRAPLGDTEMAVECRALLAPLMEAVARGKALAAARATRRTKMEDPGVEG